MKEIKIGFLVEYQVRKSFIDGYSKDSSETKKVLCSQEKVIRLLQNRTIYSVIRIQRVNITEYLLNHEDERIRVLE